MVAFDPIPNNEANDALVEWGHWLGGCNRPFGVQSFGLKIEGELLSVAVSASVPGVTCAGYNRKEVVELARLCSHPNHRDLTRPVLRLWRKIAPATWHYWPVIALVSYANAVKHTGNIYRFDGWKKAADVPGGKVSHGWQAGTKFDPKSVWVFPLEGVRRDG